MDLLTYISDMPRRIALAEACSTSPEYLWQIATRWRGKRPSPALAALIEAETARLGPEMVPKEPMIFGPAEEASKGTATEQHSARAVVGQHQSGIAPAPVASSGVSKRALRQRLGFTADAPLAKLLRLPLEQVAAWPDDQPMPALPQVLQLLGRGEEPAEPSARADQDPDAGRIVAVEGA